MAKDTGTGAHDGAVSGRTQVKNFMDIKQDATQSKGVAAEPDKRRKKT
jgi:hypothetical protein